MGLSWPQKQSPAHDSPASQKPSPQLVAQAPQSSGQSLHDSRGEHVPSLHPGAVGSQAAAPGGQNGSQRARQSGSAQPVRPSASPSKPRQPSSGVDTS